MNSDELVRRPLQRPAEILRRGYLEEEIKHLYGLARFWLETGDLRGGEIICEGLTAVAPDFAPAWLGLAYVRMAGGDVEKAAEQSNRALTAAPDSVEAMLFLTCCLLWQSDYTSAGTYLGEVSERIEAGEVTNPYAIRFFRSQLQRFQNR